MRWVIYRQCKRGQLVFSRAQRAGHRKRKSLIWWEEIGPVPGRKILLKGKDQSTENHKIENKPYLEFNLLSMKLNGFYFEIDS